jgi:hypothetical protein
MKLSKDTLAAIGRALVSILSAILPKKGDDGRKAPPADTTPRPPVPPTEDAPK